MSGCKNCGGCTGGKSGCGSCGGCAGELELTEGEVVLLEQLEEIPFLPVARRADDMTPYFLEDDAYLPETYSLILQCLEKKRLISIDYDKPLAGFDGEVYRRYPVHGSMALTARGQAVVELLNVQGIRS